VVRLDGKGKIYWHDPFFKGLKLVLHEYPLEFEKEYQLSEESLKVDVVVKKEKDIQIDKDIGKIFKSHNLFEFKSEKDTFSIWDYSKIIGYAGLYSSFRKVLTTDITISIVLTIFPRKLVDFLEIERHLTIQYIGDGIHYIKGDIFPIQILESKKLSSENLILKHLRSDLNAIELRETLQSYTELAPIDAKCAYLNGLIQANPKIFVEVMKMSGAMMEIVYQAIGEHGLSENLLKSAEKNGWLEDIYQAIGEHGLSENLLKSAEKNGWLEDIYQAIGEHGLSENFLKSAEKNGWLEDIYQVIGEHGLSENLIESAKKNGWLEDIYRAIDEHGLSENLIKSVEKNGWLEKYKNQEIIEDRRKTAKKLLLLSIPIEKVAEATELPIEVITELL